MLYDAVFHEPVAELLGLLPCGGLAFLDQPVQELRRHEGALILDPFLFPGLQQRVFRAHQSGRKEGKKNKPTGRENCSFEIPHPRCLRSLTAKLLDRCGHHVVLHMSFLAEGPASGVNKMHLLLVTERKGKPNKTKQKMVGCLDASFDRAHNS